MITLMGGVLICLERRRPFIAPIYRILPVMQKDPGVVQCQVSQPLAGNAIEITYFREKPSHSERHVIPSEQLRSCLWWLFVVWHLSLST